MKIGAKGIAISVVATILGGVVLLMALGSWKTVSEKVPMKFSSGEFAGIANPADIRGSYSFADVERNFAVTADILAAAFALDVTVKPARDYLAKDLEALYGEVADGAGEVGTDSLKWFVALYTGLPFTPAEDTYVPRTVIEVLRDSGKIADADTLARLEVRSIEPLAPGKVPETVVTHVESTTDRSIKGNTTYADVISWGVTQQEIEAILGVPLKSRTENIRSHLLANNLEFSVIKAKLQALVDSLAP
ncbi:MAG: hypothetical protein VB025_00710 [Sphaerochaeta sp.]|nr:hypothetical protein [Sphaerochaeta sp.]